MRAHFQHGVRSAGVANFRKHLLQVQRFRCGIQSLAAPSRSFVAGGADTPGCKSRGVQYGIYEKSCGGLPVCSGDADELQRVGRVPVEIRSCYRQSAALGSWDKLHPRNTGLYPCASRLRARDCNRAARDRVKHKFIPVRFLSRQGEEQRARRNLTAVARHREDIGVRRSAYANPLNALH